MTVMTNVVLVLKDSEGNIGIVKQLTDNDIIKIANAITDVGQVVDPATHMPIEATTASVGVVQLATAQDITNGTAGKVVDAQELNNFAQTLPSVNGVTDVSSGDNSNQIVVSKLGDSKTLTIDNVEHADNADEATHATQADTATSANSVAWDNVSGKPSSYTPSSHTHDDRYYTESEIDTKLGSKANSSHTHDDRYYTESEIDTKLSGKSDTTHNHNSAYLGITAKAASAKSADSVAWSNVSSRPTNVSQFTNDSGYITTDGAAYPRRVGGVTMNFNWSGQGGQPTWLWGGEDGTNMYVYNPANFSVNYANSAGSSSIAVRDSGGSWISGRDNAVVKQTRHSTGDGGSWNPAVSVKTKSGNWTIGTVGYDRLQFSYDTDEDYNTGNNRSIVVELLPESGTIITSANIGSQRVNYANGADDAGNAYNLRATSHNDHFVRSEWDGTYFWTWVRAPDGGYRPVRVERANSAGWADSAGSVAWGNVSGRPDIWIG